MTSALFPVISFRYFSLLLLGALLSVLMEVLNSSFRNDKIRMSKHVALCRRFSGSYFHFTLLTGCKCSPTSRTRRENTTKHSCLGASLARRGGVVTRVTSRE